VRRAVSIALLSLAAGIGGWRALAQGAEEHAGARHDEARRLYDRYCLACHGAFGNGEGPAAPWLWPPPRDFTTGAFKWRSTASGQPPTRADVRAAIRNGTPGTSMHAFDDALTEDQIDALAQVVVDFAGGRFAPPEAAMSLDAPDDADPARGAQVYGELGCAGCHGAEGRGDGPAAPALRDARGRPAPPYDLTARPLRRPGADGIDDIYRSLVTGIAGTGMPSFAGAAPAADLWALAA